MTTRLGSIVRVGRLISITELTSPPKAIGTSGSQVGGHSVSIGSVYGNVAVSGTTVNTTQIYNEAIKQIEESNASTGDKTNAKAVLEFVKTSAPQFLLPVAEAIKKALGL